jgi:hypothetical protein
MVKPYSNDLRERVVGAAGESHISAIEQEAGGLLA